MRSYHQHLKETFSLAYPVSLSQLGHILASFIDSVMVAQLGTVMLAASSLANSIFMVLMIGGIGITLSITPLIAKDSGSNDIGSITKLMNNAIILNIFLGVLFSSLLYLSAPLLYYLDQPITVVDNSIAYYKILALSLIPLMIFQSYRQFAEGLSKTKPAMVAIILGSGANVLLNYMLIFGNFGCPKMGLVGAGWATLLSRVIMLLIMGIHIHSNKFYRAYNVTIGLSCLSLNILKKILNVGLPIGLQMVLEVGAFAFAAIMMGWIGKDALAAHQIALSYSSISFMIVLGIATAATIRIGNTIGQKNFSELRRTGYAAQLLVSIVTLSAASIFIFARNYLPSIYTEEALVSSLAASYLVIVGLFQLADGIQVTTIGILRGMTDVNIPSLIAVTSFWIIGLPAGYILGFPLKMEGEGIWLGILIGLVLSSILSFVRFQTMIARYSNK